MSACTIALAVLHGYAIWSALEGLDGLTNGWPLWREDHPLYFHYASVTRTFLNRSGTTAGYDPSFMAGHAKSVVFPLSGTLPELVVAVFGGNRPVLAYKLYVLISAAAIPWLIALAARFWRIGPGGTLGAVGLFLLYVWTDFPINYAAMGMVPYLLAIPLGLAASGAFLRYCKEGGLRWWLVSATLMSLVVLVHSTSAMVVAPAAALIYLGSIVGSKLSSGRERFSKTRHAGVWLIPAVVLASNAFWWLPGLWLSSTRGSSGFAFAHKEGVLARLLQIGTTEPPIELMLCIAGSCGLVCLFRRDRTGSLGLLGFAAAGFGWGYLAGGSRSLDFLQPGRHTYAYYSALCLAAGYGLAQGLTRLRGRFRMDMVGLLVLATLGTWFLGPIVVRSMRFRVLAPVPFLSSRPSPRMSWVITRVGKFVEPGERLLYEEGGFQRPGIYAPFQGGRFSGLLPEMYGIELIGGPYLHAALTTNFTQFGEGQLFGRTDWDRDWFVRYARLYRPSAILCWSPHARAFCRENPDLIEVKDDNGVFLIGRVWGFEGAAIEGKARVVATPGRLQVSGLEGGLDGSVVLRYHSIPCLRADPPVALAPVFLEGDPVPFIRLRPTPGTVVIEQRFPPWTERTPRR